MFISTDFKHFLSRYYFGFCEHNDEEGGVLMELRED